MRVATALIADYASQTNDGKLVVAGIFDTLFVADTPARHAHMALALRIQLHPGEATKHDLKLRLVDPDGQNIIPELDGGFDVSGVDPVSGASAQFVLNMENLEFKTFGRHSFDIFIDGRFEESVTLTVAAAPPGMIRPITPGQ